MTPRERLKYLAENVLSNVPPANFDMFFWKSDRAECGTVACACGWAAMNPVLNQEGLDIINPGSGHTPFLHIRQDTRRCLGFLELTTKTPYISSIPVLTPHTPSPFNKS